MSAPLIPLFSGTTPNRNQSANDFANNADDWLNYQAPLAADYNDLAAYLDALALTPSIDDVTVPYIFKTVQDFKGFPFEFPDGKTIITKEFLLGNGGGATYKKITGTGTSNNMDIIASPLVDQSISFDFDATGVSFTSKQLGAAVDGDGNQGGTDDHAVLNRGVQLSQSEKKTFIPSDGTHFSSQTLDILNQSAIKGVFLREKCIIDFAVGINGLRLPTGANSVTGMEIENLTIKSDNIFPDAALTFGIQANTTGSVRFLNIHNVVVIGFMHGVDGRCPFFECTFKNLNLFGIIVRDIFDIQNYVEDDSWGICFGFDDRDATTVTCENVAATGYGKGFFNIRCAALQFINCVSERNFWGLYAEKGCTGTMYQEWNKNSVRAVGLREPSGVQILAINEPSSWGPVTADSKAVARGCSFRTLKGGRESQFYTNVTSLVITGSKQFLEFNTLNDVAITPAANLPNRIMGEFEVEVNIIELSDPSIAGTLIFDIEVLEEGGSFTSVRRAFIKSVAADKFVGSGYMNYKSILLGTLTNVRVGVSFVDGEGFTLSGGEVSLTVRRLNT
jgi:hypothetical protein